ncbi:unnamed protein product, partial [Iphiclides podalirius]
MEDLQLNISTGKTNNRPKKTAGPQRNASEYKFLAKPIVGGKIIARKRPQNVRNSFSKQNFDEPKQKVAKSISETSAPKSVNLESSLRDLSENKGKFKEKNYQQLSDDLQVKQKPRSGGWISSLFKNNPDVPRIGQKAVKPIVEKVFTGQTFADLDLHPHSIANLSQNLSLNQLMTVQQNAIPVILQGRDVLIRSQTGSGKTLAYALPIIEGLQAIRPKINRHDGIRVIVVVPTRELAVQTYELFVKLVKPFIWIVPGLLSGGQKRKAEKARLRKGLSILVGTPGRINDHLRHTHSLNFAKTGCLVLDEADRLLDMGYEKDVAAIVKAIDDHKKAATYDPIALMKQSVKSNVSNNEVTNIVEENAEEHKVRHYLTEVFLSKDRQTILLSATLTKAVENLAGITMQNPVFIDTSEGKVLVADSLKHQDNVNNKEATINKSIEKSLPETVRTNNTEIMAEKQATNKNTAVNDVETRRGMKAFSGVSNLSQIEDDSGKKQSTKKTSNKPFVKKEADSDSDSDYEYFKVQKELESKKPKVVETMKEVQPAEAENVFLKALKSAVVEDELVLPATVNQKFMVVPMKLRLVTLCSLIVEHCVLNKKGGKMIVFMATTEMVDYHSELLETVLTGKEDKVKKKNVKNKMSKSKKRKLDNNQKDEGGESGSSESSESELEMDYGMPEEGSLAPVDLDVFSLHGSMAHEHRMEVFKQFRAARRGLLICTDVAARGLDVPRVDLVLQYCAPASATDYVHRVGRTGRAAQVGAAVLMLLPSEAEFVRHLEQKRIRLRQADESQSLEALRTLSPAAPNPARAAIALQARLEHTAHSHRDWLQRASRAYTSWVRFYSGYPREVRVWLDARQLHLGHAAKAFALRETPAALARRAKCDPDTKKERPNNRLTVHEEEQRKRPGFPKVKPGLFGNRVMNKQSSMHTASEFDSGLPPLDNYNQKKKNKNKRWT